MLEASPGTSRTIELDYPSIQLEDDVILSPLKGEFQAIRNSKGIYITGTLTSKIGADCARCLDPLMLDITITMDDLFYYPPHTAPQGEFSVGEDGFLDLAPLVRQLSLLEIPMQPFCKPDCKGLCVECGQNLNDAEPEANAHVNLAHDYLIAGESDKAFEHLKKAQQLFDSDIWFRWRYNIRLQAEFADYWIVRGDLALAAKHTSYFFSIS